MNHTGAVRGVQSVRSTSQMRGLEDEELDAETRRAGLLSLVVSLICIEALGVVVPIPTFAPVYEISVPVFFQFTSPYFGEPSGLNPSIA